MNNNRSRAATLVGLGAAAGAFGVAAMMMSAATAPSARADAYTDIINAVDDDFANGQANFGAAFTDFGSGDQALGLATFFAGVNDDALSAPNNLFIGTVEALTNESITPGFGWDLGTPANFTEGLTDAQGDFAYGQDLLSLGATDFSSGEYGLAAFYDTLGSDYLSVVPLEEILIGAAASL